VGASSAQVLATREWDVLIVGAGPAGLSAGRLLAAERLSVLVLEEHAEIGDPVHCTGVLGLDAFTELDLPRETISTITRSAKFHGGYGRSIRIDGGEVAAAVVDRGRFDRALAERASGAGATILRGARVTALDVNDCVTARVVIEDCQHAVRGRVCVLACGAQYRFNRQLGLGIPRAYLQSAQLEMPFPHVDDVEIDLDRGLAPRGFAWMVPFTRGDVGMARVGLMASDAAGRRFRTYTRRLGERHGAGLAAASPRLKVLPLAPVKRTYADRVVAVGDAAGLAKPTTGGGIYYSLLSGRYAAEVLSSALRHDRTDASSLKPYETLWQARIGPELRAGLAFRTLVTRFDDRAIDALIELAAVDGIVPLLRRTANVNWHRAAALALLKNPGFRRIVLSSLWT
jgi:geranylgeranyl reductase family protein